MLNLSPKTPILGKFEGKTRILSTNDLRCEKFAAVCVSENCNLLRRLLFVSHDAATDVYQV